MAIKRKMIALSVILSMLLAGCDSIERLKSNAEEVASKITDQGEMTLGDSTTTSSESEEVVEVEPEKIIYGIDGSSLGIFTQITNVVLTTEPKKVSMRFIVDDQFSIEESLTFTRVKVEDKDAETSDDKPAKKYETVVTCESSIRIGAIDDFQKVFDYLNRSAFDKAEFKGKEGVYTATLEQPYILAGAPLNSYVDCKAYCETLYTKLHEDIDNSRRIRDGSTGIIYHNIGGNEFNLVKYRYQVRSGENIQIEIQDIPEGFTTEDITFHSDKVGYARVSGNGTVTGVNNGSATITVSLRGAAVYRTVYVQVY